MGNQQLNVQLAGTIFQYESYYKSGRFQDAYALFQAIHGATKSGLEFLREYGTRIEREVKFDPEKLNPDKNNLVSVLSQILNNGVSATTRDILVLPWNRGTQVQLDTLLAAFISFADMHEGKIQMEYFPVEQTLEYIIGIYKETGLKGRTLNVAEQYRLALDITEGNPLAAAILAHSAFRVTGRNLDTRISPRFNFDMGSRVSLAKSVSLFDQNSAKCPLGDTYHFWAHFTAGMVYYLKKNEEPLKSKLFYLIFYNGPNFMYLVQEFFLRRPLMFGTHKEVDRLGINIGIQMAKRLAEMQD